MMVQSVRELVTDYNWITVILGLLLIIEVLPKIVDGIAKFLKTFGLNVETNSMRDTNRMKDLLENNAKRLSEVEECYQKLLISIDKITEKLEVAEEDKLKDKIENLRWKIIEGANARANGKFLNMEQYNMLFNSYIEYEEILEKNELENGQTADSVEYLHIMYKQDLANGVFKDYIKKRDVQL